MPKSPYEILGVTEAATKGEIRSAYRTLARTHHPDKGGTVDGFTKIQKAYELLSDQKRRNAYDVLHGVVKNSQQAQQQGANPFIGFHSSYNLSNQQYKQFVNQYFQQAMAGNSAPAPQSNRKYFTIPRYAIRAGKVASIPQFSVNAPTYGVDEIEVEIDFSIFTSEYPMPNDIVRLEFSHQSQPMLTTVDAIVLQATYSVNNHGRPECRLRVRRAGSWQTQP